jgi:hypothetical protein
MAVIGSVEVIASGNATSAQLHIDVTLSVRPTTMHAISVLYRTVTRAFGADEAQPDSGFGA